MSRTILLALLSFAVLAATAALAQETCQKVPCGEDSFAQGEFPKCFCPKPPPPVGPPTCSRDFACISGEGVGKWPDCGCIDPVKKLPGPGNVTPPEPFAPAFQPSLGGVKTCKEFFKCLPGFEMLLWNGFCVCGAEMLPPPN